MPPAALMAWVLQHHEQHPEQLEQCEDPKNPSVCHGPVLWWGVLNTEAVEHMEPESVWPRRAMAERRAKQLNRGRYPSWRAEPVVLSMWLRNEEVPTNLEQEECAS